MLVVDDERDFAELMQFRLEQNGYRVLLADNGLTAIDQARREGMKVGHLRLVVAWPFPEERIRALSSQVKAFVVPELNFGQMALEVERCAAGKANVVCVPHAGGTVHDPKEIYAGIRASVKGGR